MVTNGTYGYCCGLDHAYRGRSLGHWLGPDGDDLYVEMSHRVNPSATVRLSYAYTSHGQGSIGQPPPGPDDWFLSGVVERRHTVGLQIHRIHSLSLETRYRAEVASVANRGNVAGTHATEGLLGADVTYRWPAAAAPVSAAPADTTAAAPPDAPGRISLRSWAAAATSQGPLSAPPGGTLLGRFAHGTVSVFAGWGGMRFRGTLAGAPEDVTFSGPRAGMEFLYRAAPGGLASPLYLSGHVSTNLRGFSPVDLPLYLWTYSLGAGWTVRGVTLEAGYRGAAGLWQVNTPDQTVLRWDGLYVTLSFR